jgi:DNA-directed RNA polymerase subunit omega
MARVTVEDCIEHVPNRFELVALASTRARQIVSGSPLNVERDNDKDTVVSLREIAEQKVDLEQLRAEIILAEQKFGKKDIIDDSNLSIPRLSRQDVAEDLSSMQDDLSEDVLEDDAAAAGLGFADDDVADED